MKNPSGFKFIPQPNKLERNSKKESFNFFILGDCESFDLSGIYKYRINKQKQNVCDARLFL